MSDTQNFTGTRPVAGQHLFDEVALANWLQSRLPGFEGPLTVEMFKGGQSNPTYKLITPQRAYVMRAKPGPVAKLLPSAHAIEREFRVMSALQGTGVPVAQMHVLCEDESVIGRAFYIMECVNGRVLWDQSLPGMTNEQRGAIYNEMNRVIAALHTVKPLEIGLDGYGKPGNYFERQIGRWSKQYLASITQPIPEMDRLIEWLPTTIPAQHRSSIAHGDYRLDNMIFHKTQARIIAVLDWELSTLGDPIADFSYLMLNWISPPDGRAGIGGLDHAALGIPTMDEAVARYVARTGFPVPPMDWYFAFNLFRLAGIIQGIKKRVIDGTASSAHAREMSDRVLPLVQRAYEYARKAGLK